MFKLTRSKKIEDDIVGELDKKHQLEKEILDYVLANLQYKERSEQLIEAYVFYQKKMYKEKVYKPLIEQAEKEHWQSAQLKDAALKLTRQILGDLEL